MAGLLRGDNPYARSYVRRVSRAVPSYFSMIELIGSGVSQI